VYTAAQVAANANSAIRAQLAPVSIYQSPTMAEIKTITLRVTAVSDDRTLTDEDATKLLESIEGAVTAL
jgi:phenylalanyl-tRNA synthetase beta subunit